MRARLIGTVMFSIGAVAGAVIAGQWLTDRALDLPAVRIDRVSAESPSSVSATAAADRAAAPVGRGGAVGRRNADSLASIDPEARRLALESFALAAGNDPEAALADALSIDDVAMQQSALRRIAAAWARRDPEQALMQVPLLPRELRAAFRSAVAEEWAFVDPSGFMAHAETADSIAPLVAGLDVLIATDPERVWDLVLRSGTRSSGGALRVYRNAVFEMVRRDPRTALALIEPRTSGPLREVILTAAAEAYAEIDERAALAWAVSVQPPLPVLIETIVESVAATDALRAVELALDAYAAGGNPLDQNRGARIATATFATDQDPGPILDALVERGLTESAASLIGPLLQHWTRDDPVAAVDWLAAHPTSVDSNQGSVIARYLARADPELAADLTDRVPPAFRDSWVSIVAMGYGESDPAGALTWVDTLQGLPEHSAAQEYAVFAVAWADLPLAIRYVENAGAAIDPAAAAALTDQWAQVDPAAAADWAVGLTRLPLQSAALEGVTTRWLQDEPAAAESWVLEQPRGPARDRLLEIILSSNAVGDLDAARLLEAFDSNRLRRQAEVAIAGGE